MQRVFTIVALAVIVVSGFTLGASNVSYAAPAFHPTVSDWQFVSAGPTPPTQADCIAGIPVGRRCFNPTSMANSYNYAVLHSLGNEGQGKTIAVVDSWGSDTIAHDLHVFDQAFGLQAMCGEEGVTCAAGMPTFSRFSAQGTPATNTMPPNNSPGIEDKAAWAVEVSLDVEWAHATAPMANILLVTTPTAETLGVQGFPQMMNAVQQVVDNHMADVISMSLAAGEGTFNGPAAMMQLRQAFVDAQAEHVTVFGSSGDNGTANTTFAPVAKGGNLIPYPSVEWPASDPLVTGVGGTYLCTDGPTGTFVDSANPPGACKANPGVREVGWIAGGGGYSIFFPRPDYQNTLPAGSTFAGTSAGAPGPNSNMRGVPDIAYQASAQTGVLVYVSLSPFGASGFRSSACGGVCSDGWYVVGGTSAGSPQWAGIAAMADQMAGRDLGFLNPGLYAVASNPAMYANDFYDVTAGNNQLDPTIPGYSASAGWDAVTGLGTPNVANLIPDLIAATP